MVESGMEEGVDDGFDRLDELLERLATPRLEVVVPVSDVDRAKHFYAEQMGFPVDVDHARTSCSASSR